MTYARDFARDGQRLPVQVKHLRQHVYQVQVGDRRYEVEARRLPDGRLRFRLDGRDHEAMGSGNQVRVDGKTWRLERYHAGHGGGETAADGMIQAPMTGTVLKLPVTAGADVEAGDTVAVIAAMKMEHKLHAGISGRVTALHVKEGDTVDQGAVLMLIEART